MATPGEGKLAEICVRKIHFGTDQGKMCVITEIAFSNGGLGPEVTVRCEVDVEPTFTFEQILTLASEKAIELVRELAALPDESI